jgi:hypothetical protein
MRKVFYFLEDNLFSHAAKVRFSFVQRSLGVVSRWAGWAGDLVGEIEEIATRPAGEPASRSRNAFRHMTIKTMGESKPTRGDQLQ